MAEKAKKGDFIEIDYVARIKGTNSIFDLTRADVAKKEGIFNEGKKYKPLIVCLGAGHLLRGLDKGLEGKEVGKELLLEIDPEDAFGRRNPKLIQLTTLKQFKDKGVNPVPGLQLAIDGALATIRSVSGGRVIIDFNHPLAGKTLIYQIKINRIVTDAKEKISGLVSLLLDLDPKDCLIKIDEKEINIEIKKNVPKELLEKLKKQIKNLIPEVGKKKVEIQIKTK